MYMYVHSPYGEYDPVGLPIRNPESYHYIQVSVNYME